MEAVWLRHLELLYRPFVGGGLIGFSLLANAGRALIAVLQKKMLCRRWVGEEQAETLQSRLAGQRLRTDPEQAPSSPSAVPE